MVKDATSRRPSIGPFGATDGARADLQDIQAHFVDFTDLTVPDDLASPADDRSARIIVGKKGVGKTIYLRRFQDNALHEKSLYADNVHSDVPTTDDVIRICEMYREALLASEAWELIWRRSIFRSVVSHLLRKPRLREGVGRTELEAFQTDFQNLIGEPKGARSVYAEARAIVSLARSHEQLSKDMKHPDWDDLEDRVAQMLEHLPPVCFYLDSVDERFGTAPAYWLLCQKGLFRVVLELLREPRFGNRLHLVVSMRDLVRSALLRGEHSTRYLDSQYIRVLDWNYPAIRYLLLEKIRRLNAEFKMAPGREGVAGWLGREVVYNPSRGVEERLEEYLLRHTRQIPRDVVHLGNRLCLEVVKAKATGESEVRPDAIRKAVGVAAKEFADEQIAVCANHLASDAIPRGAARQSFSDFYTSELYSQSVQGELRRFIAKVACDRFPMNTLREALTSLEGSTLSQHRSPLNVLWLNGLLGHEPPRRGDTRSHFYGADDVDDFELPEDMKTYVFHPIVGHTVHIEAAGDRPVRPFG